MSTQQMLQPPLDELKGPWPDWAKRAAARMLHMCLPSISMREWMSTFSRQDDLIALFEKFFDDGGVWGRGTRYITEFREKDPKIFEQLSDQRWIKRIKDNDGKLEIEHGQGIHAMLAHRLEHVLELAPSNQAVFWRSFARGFGGKTSFRRQDVKAFRIYLFLTIAWPCAKRCRSIRELYDWLFSSTAKESCPEGVDPIDFEERQFKWFEKLCHRNLRLTLARKGRPKRKN